jgi:hypothetical protein
MSDYTPRTLSEAVKAIATAKTAASQEVSYNPIDHTASEMAIQMAKNDLVFLSKEVKHLTNKVSGGIFVDGPTAKEFAAVAEDEGGAVTVDAGEVYEVLTDAVERTLTQNNSREWRLDIIHALMGNLAGLGQRLGIAYMAGLNTTKYTRSLLATRADTLAMVRDVVRAAVGDDLNGLKLQQDIADAVIKAECEQNVLPVVVLNAHPDDVTGLGSYVFSGRYIKTTTKEELLKEDVITAFKHLKPLLKRNS